MSLRAQVEALPTLYVIPGEHDGFLLVDDVLDLIPEDAILVTRESLAAALHAGPHSDRGGVDGDLARSACIQFGWEASRCVQRADAIIARLRS